MCSERLYQQVVSVCLFRQSSNQVIFLPICRTGHQNTLPILGAHSSTLYYRFTAHGNKLPDFPNTRGTTLAMSHQGSASFEINHARRQLHSEIRARFRGRVVLTAVTLALAERHQEYFIDLTSKSAPKTACTQ